MTEVKIQCPCGTRYVFDVEPMDGQMPSAVQCPECAADGTAAANQILRAKSGGPVRINVVAHAAPTAPTAPPPTAFAASPAVRSAAPVGGSGGLLDRTRAV